MIDQEKIHNLCLSDHLEERIIALRYFYDFLSMPDEQQAWDDLHRLTDDEESSVKICAAVALGHAFSHVPDKQKAWDDLNKLTNDKDSVVRVSVAIAFDFAFSYIPDKQQAWNSLHRLINDKNNDVKRTAIETFGSVFSHVPDKQKAWKALHRLTNDEVIYLKRTAIKTLGSVFSYVPNKQQAWNNLHRLTNDEDSGVRSDTAYALGSAFSHVPDKQKAWDDLNRLTKDENSNVRTFSNHSLGRVSIYKASQAETNEDFKNELENAIDFFEKAAQESKSWSNPSEFCLPFYRSFHAIIFRKQKSREEVAKYLEEAKAAIEGSESKAHLFEAVNNLANALNEVQSLKYLDFETKKGEFNFYRKYCDRAAELMRETEEEAPYATATMRKGLPILDRNLKELIEEIQNKAKIACQASQGTSTQEIACAINREVQKWEIGSQEEMTQMIENLAHILEEKISVQHKNQYILGKIDLMKSERNLVKQYEILAQIIPLIRNVTVVPVEPVLEKMENLEEKIDSKFEEIIVSLKSGPHAEIVISMGLKALGSGAQGVITIPLKEIDYPEVNIDLEKIKKEGTKLSEFSQRFVDKIKGFLP